MTTFIKTKFDISDDQTNIDKYRLAANITEYHIISKLILQRILITIFVVQYVIVKKLLFKKIRRGVTFAPKALYVLHQIL